MSEPIHPNDMRWPGKRRSLTPMQEMLLPEEVILAARQCLGGFDLAPHASELANSALLARRCIAPQDNALLQNWAGRVLLTPPARQPGHSMYLQKLLTSYAADQVSSAVVISNSPEILRLMPELLDFPLCIPFRRLRYRWPAANGELRTSSPSSWNVILFLPRKDSLAVLDEDVRRFREAFRLVGRCLFDRESGDDWREAFEMMPLRSRRPLVLTGLKRTAAEFAR